METYTVEVYPNGDRYWWRNAKWQGLSVERRQDWPNSV